MDIPRTIEGEGKPLEGVEGLSGEIVKRARLALEFDDDIAR